MESMESSGRPAGARRSSSLYFDVAPGVWGTKDVFVNMYMVQNEEDQSWVLIDAGLKSSGPKIKKMAAVLFGSDSKPSAIVLTHGHFDHVGSLARLAAEWHVPVYAHYLELPYLTGKSSYPPPDPGVGGGLMASMSWLYPKKPINIEGMVHTLPEDHTIPGLPGWKWIHTPGHAPGHVSLYRESDRVLIAGDAFVTTKQESALSVMRQEKVLSGPPKYFTYDWGAAERSVSKLASINPDVAATGHGMPMRGDKLKTSLADLSAHFRSRAVPTRGRYVGDPAVADANGVLYVPVDEGRTLYKTLVVLGSAVAITALTYLIYKANKKWKAWYEVD